MAEIKLTINGQEVRVKNGMTVLQSAQNAGIYIPTLCYAPDLEPYGGCRLCVVEIEKMRGLPTACTTPANEGMIVHTETPAVNQVRRSAVQLLIAEHPMDCLSCVKNQRCDLQQVAAYLGITEREFPRTNREFPVDTSNPFFNLDRNYCILCAQCVRACDEICGVNAIDLSFRGYATKVATFNDGLMIDSNCESCGECVAHCPVAALTPKDARQPTREVETTCPYCGVGCGIYLGMRDGQVITVRGNTESPVNKGHLCVKGRFGVTEFINHPDRLTTPLIRRDGKLVEATWDEALDLVAGRLANYKGDEVARLIWIRCK